jgi:DNA topoisomerase 2-associated protein PAT1
LTIFLSRAESLKQSTPPPDAQDLVQWQQTFTTVFHTLAGDFPSLFPSTRAAAPVPFGASYYLSRPEAAINSTGRDLDLDDEPIWRFLAAVAVCADPQEQQTLVTSVRDKVMENVSSATKSRVSPEVGALKIVSHTSRLLPFALTDLSTLSSATSICYCTRLGWIRAS